MRPFNCIEPGHKVISELCINIKVEGWLEFSLKI